jgi:hypothetical protein
MFLKITKVFFLVAVLAAVISILLNLLNIDAVFNRYWYVSILFFLGTGLLINYILFGKPADPKDFVMKIMFTSMLRLLMCMIGVFIYSLIDKPHLISFSLHFMLHYILFTIFEISFLLKHTKSQIQKS